MSYKLKLINKNTSDKINLNSVNVRSIENFGDRLKLSESQKKMERTEFYVKEIIEYKETTCPIMKTLS